MPFCSSDHLILFVLTSFFLSHEITRYFLSFSNVNCPDVYSCSARSRWQRCLVPTSNIKVSILVRPAQGGNAVLLNVPRHVALKVTCYFIFKVRVLKNLLYLFIFIYRLISPTYCFFKIQIIPLTYLIPFSPSPLKAVRHFCNMFLLVAWNVSFQ